MRLSILSRIMEIEEGVIRRGRRPTRIIPSDLHNILHMIRKPNSITVLLFFEYNSQFKNIAKTCLPPSIHRCSVHLRQCTCRFVQLRKYSPNSRCRPSSCLLAVLAMFLAIFRLVLTLETSEMSAIFSSSQPKQLNLVPSFSRLTVH